MRYKVIAIEREYASGGREIGEKLAERLNVPCYGQEILERAADKIGLPLNKLSDLEENMTGSLLFSLNMFATISSGGSADLTWTQKLALAEANIVRDLALSPCVMIGRSAAGLLKDTGDALKVFVHADYDTRIKRAIEIYHVNPKSAESTLRRNDRRRANYFKTITGVEWKDGDTYQMVLNSGKLGIDPVADILASVVGAA